MEDFFGTWLKIWHDTENAMKQQNSYKTLAQAPEKVVQGLFNLDMNWLLFPGMTGKDQTTSQDSLQAAGRSETHILHLENNVIIMGSSNSVDETAPVMVTKFI